jgi:hypothetical protein
MAGSVLKDRVVYPLEKWVVNPVVMIAHNLGLPPPGDALLGTTGRRTGRPRRTPVCDGLDGERFWLVAQRRDPRQRPPLVFGPAVHRRAFVQLGAQPGQLRRRQAAHRPACAPRGQRRSATRPPAPPPLIGRLRAHPQLARHPHRLHILLEHCCGLQPHLLPPRPARSGQATTIGISHTSRRRPGRGQDHAGAPTVIRQTAADLDNSISVNVVFPLDDPGGPCRLRRWGWFARLRRWGCSARPGRRRATGRVSRT